MCSSTMRLYSPYGLLGDRAKQEGKASQSCSTVHRSDGLNVLIGFFSSTTGYFKLASRLLFALTIQINMKCKMHKCVHKLLYIYALIITYAFIHNCLRMFIWVENTNTCLLFMHKHFHMLIFIHAYTCYAYSKMLKNAHLNKCLDMLICIYAYTFLNA